MTAPRPRNRQARQLDAGMFQAEISSFRLHLAAEGKSARTIQTYTEAAAWFAGEWLAGRTSRTMWAQVGRRDVQEWMAYLPGAVQHRVREQPVPGPAAVLQMARGGGGPARPDGRAAPAEGRAQAGAGVQRHLERGRTGR
jgi:hypothetical protein